MTTEYLSRPKEEPNKIKRLGLLVFLLIFMSGLIVETPLNSLNTQALSAPTQEQELTSLSNNGEENIKHDLIVIGVIALISGVIGSVILAKNANNQSTTAITEVKKLHESVKDFEQKMQLKIQGLEQDKKLDTWLLYFVMSQSGLLIEKAATVLDNRNTGEAAINVFNKIGEMKMPDKYNFHQEFPNANVKNLANVVKDSAQVGDTYNNQTSELSSVELSQLVEDIHKIIENLANCFPSKTETEEEKQKLVCRSISSQVKNNPEFQRRLRSAVSEGASELTAILNENSFVRVPLAMVRGWIRT